MNGLAALVVWCLCAVAAAGAGSQALKVVSQILPDEQRVAALSRDEVTAALDETGDDEQAESRGETPKSVLPSVAVPLQSPSPRTAQGDDDDDETRPQSRPKSAQPAPARRQTAVKRAETPSASETRSGRVAEDAPEPSVEGTQSEGSGTAEE